MKHWQQDHTRAGGKYKFGEPQSVHMKEWGGYQQAVAVLTAGADTCSDCPKLTVVRQGHTLRTAG
jgi:hypothetical protein